MAKKEDQWSASSNGKCTDPGCIFPVQVDGLCSKHYQLRCKKVKKIHWTDAIIDEAVANDTYKKPKPGTLAKLVNDRRPERVSRYQPVDYDEQELLRQLPPALDPSEREEMTLEDLKRMHGDG